MTAFRSAALVVLLACSADAATAHTATSTPPPATVNLVELRAPLSTVVEAKTAPAGDKLLTVALIVPADAPEDLGIGAFTEDRDGHWFQCAKTYRLAPGAYRLRFSLTGGDRLVAEPELAVWRGDSGARADRAGIYLWSASASRAKLRVDELTVQPAPTAKPSAAHPEPAMALLDCALTGYDDDAEVARGSTGERWTLECVPQPFPVNPYDSDQFRLDALITTPSGTVLRVPGFYLQPMAVRDRGDREDLAASTAGRFQVRFRPSQPGRYHLRIDGVWKQDSSRTISQELPDLVVDGSPKTLYAQVDAQDRRFFAIGNEWYWPIGLNLHSPYDLRSRDALGTKLTPARGSQTYRAMFERIAIAGVDAVEIWMGAWNLALEWRGDWPGYAGLGRYNQANAWRLDAILDAAWAHGIRINLVINNHGQASPSSDREWKDNPYNSKNGGPLDEPIELFENPAALAGQEKLRRYLVARYADHPAILGWKLWSEVDLTAARGDVVWRWHEHAAERWHELDVYDHPVTTHWAGDFRRVNPQVAELPGIDYLCIDAYRRGGRGGGNGDWPLLANILADSTQYPNRGLHRYGKPTLVTEFGATSNTAPENYRAVDHRIGAWAALVSGHAGAPMLWWWEWVDQGERWQPYGAIARFIAGEDPRAAKWPTDTAAADQPHSVELSASGGGNDNLWVRAWMRPGRMLGYILDPAWGTVGGEAPRIADGKLQVGTSIAAGRLTAEWWNADTGMRFAGDTVVHPGGELRLALPPFAGHLAFKLYRMVEKSATDARPAETP